MLVRKLSSGIFGFIALVSLINTFIADGVKTPGRSYYGNLEDAFERDVAIPARAGALWRDAAETLKRRFLFYEEKVNVLIEELEIELKAAEECKDEVLSKAHGPDFYWDALFDFTNRYKNNPNLVAACLKNLELILHEEKKEKKAANAKAKPREQAAAEKAKEGANAKAQDEAAAAEEKAQEYEAAAAKKANKPLHERLQEAFNDDVVPFARARAQWRDRAEKIRKRFPSHEKEVDKLIKKLAAEIASEAAAECEVEVLSKAREGRDFKNALRFFEVKYRDSNPNVVDSCLENLDLAKEDHKKRIAAEAEAKAQAEADTKTKAEEGAARAKARAESDAKAKAEADAKTKAEAAAARAKAEAEAAAAKAKAQAEAKAKKAQDEAAAKKAEDDAERRIHADIQKQIDLINTIYTEARFDADKTRVSNISDPEERRKNARPLTFKYAADKIMAPVERLKLRLRNKELPQKLKGKLDECWEHANDLQRRWIELNLWH